MTIITVKGAHLSYLSEVADRITRHLRKYLHTKKEVVFYRDKLLSGYDLTGSQTITKSIKTKGGKTASILKPLRFMLYPWLGGNEKGTSYKPKHTQKEANINCMPNDNELQELAKGIALAVGKTRSHGGEDSPYPTPALSGFGMKLGVLRRKRNLSLKKLAQLTKIDEYELLNVELGLAPLSKTRSYIATLAPFLGTSENILYRYLDTLALDVLGL